MDSESAYIPKGRFRKIIDWYFSRNVAPYWLLVVIDLLILLVCTILVYFFFMGYVGLRTHFWALIRTYLLYSIPFLICFRLFHTYRAVVRFSSFVDLLHIVYAMGVSGIVVILLHYLTNQSHGFFVELRGVQILVIVGSATLLMLAVRVVVKMLYDFLYMSQGATRAFIYGIQAGGIGLAKSIRNEKPARFAIKGFISHDPKLNYAHLLGERVFPVDERLPEVLKKYNVKAVLVSPLRHDIFRRDQQLQDYIINSGAKIYMMPKPDEWVPGQAPVLTPVNIEDLLPRDQIQVDLDSIGSMIMGSRVLVTGSAGSIGSEIVRQVAKFGPSEMMLIDQAETPQHDIRLMMARNFPEVKATSMVASITAAARMESIFASFKPDYVLHAAAYKHVPMMEDNPCEAVLNNVLGTRILADMAVKYGTRKFVMISTDKAVNPTNVMGCSKRICEIYVQALNVAEVAGRVDGRTQFVTTRFGNVLGSNGSVIPLFQEQIRAGGPVTVTDPNIVRFFMLIPEACKLVLEAGTKGNGGEIFVFDMGEPVRIADLAKRMIRLSGAEGVEIVYTGLRDGEKLYEEVLSDKEGTLPSFHEKIRIAQVRQYDYDEACRQIDRLVELACTYDDMATVAKMKEIVPEYISNKSVYSVLDKNKDS